MSNDRLTKKRRLTRTGSVVNKDTWDMYTGCLPSTRYLLMCSPLPLDTCEMIAQFASPTAAVKRDFDITLKHLRFLFSLEIWCYRCNLPAANSSLRSNLNYCMMDSIFSGLCECWEDSDMGPYQAVAGRFVDLWHRFHVGTPSFRKIASYRHMRNILLAPDQVHLDSL